MNTENLKKLKLFIKKQGLTQQELAQKLGVTQAYVAAVLNGKSELGKKNAEKWGAVLDISSTWLLTGEGDFCKNDLSADDTTAPPQNEGTTISVPIEMLNKFTDMLEIIVSQQRTLTLQQEIIIKLLTNNSINN